MGNTGSGDIPAGARESAKKFSQEELAVLKGLFKDLSSRSPGDTVDKDAFLKLFPLPGLLGERLFQLFDKKNTGVVDFEEFLSGMATVCRGSPDERVVFLFQLYDLNGQGSVLKQEMRSLLCHIPLPILSDFAEPGAKLVDDSGTINLAEVDRIVDAIYSKYDSSGKGALSFECFKKFLDDTPIMDMFLRSVFPIEPDRPSSVPPKSPAHGSAHAGAGAGGSSDLRLPTGSPPTPLQNPRSLTTESSPGSPIVVPRSGEAGGTAQKQQPRGPISDPATASSIGIIHAYRRGSSDWHDAMLGKEGSLSLSRRYGLYCRSCKFAIVTCSACGEKFTEETKTSRDADTGVWTVECSSCGAEGAYRRMHRESSATSGDLPPQEDDEEDSEHAASKTPLLATTAVETPTGKRAVSPLALPDGTHHADGADAPPASVTAPTTIASAPSQPTNAAAVARGDSGRHRLNFLDRLQIQLEATKIGHIPPPPISVKSTAATAAPIDDDDSSEEDDEDGEDMEGFLTPTVTDNTGAAGAAVPVKGSDRKGSVGSVDGDGSAPPSAENTPGRSHAHKHSNASVTASTTASSAFAAATNSAVSKTSPHVASAPAPAPHPSFGRSPVLNASVSIASVPPPLAMAIPAPPQPVHSVSDRTTPTDDARHVVHTAHSSIGGSLSAHSTPVAHSSGAVRATPLPGVQIDKIDGISRRTSSFQIAPSSVLSLKECPKCAEPYGEHDWVPVRQGRGHRYGPASGSVALDNDTGTLPSVHEPHDSEFVIDDDEIEHVEEADDGEGDDTPTATGSKDGSFRKRSQSVSWETGAGAGRSMTQLGLKTLFMEGWLYKIGRKTRRMTKRYFKLNQNFLYWYNNDNPSASLLGVLFIEGSYVSPLVQEPLVSKGYYGISIHTSVAHGEQNRVLYAKGAEDHAEWLEVLKRASNVVPFEDVYVLGREIGSGRFSKVYEATHKVTGATVAVKLITKADLKENERELLRTEIAVLKLVKHPHVVRLEAVFETPTIIYIVMERVKGGELFHRIVGRARFSEAEARALVVPLLQAVAYIHGMGIIHRDIKPENILCGNSLTDIKLADFGLSKLVTPHEIMKMACGTLSYVAPEVLTMKGYGKEADLWSVGVILYLIVRGRLPFEAATREEVLARTAAGRPDFSHAVWQKWSPVGRAFVAGLLAKDPRKRLTAEQALKHPWMQLELPKVDLSFQ